MSSSFDVPRRSPSRDATLLRAVLVGAVLGVVLTLAGLLTWLWLHRDRTPSLTMQALETARRRWEQSHVTDYDLEVQLSGQREGVILTKVRGGVIVEHTNNGRTPDRRVWDYWSVEGMLDAIERELEISADDVAASQRGMSQMALRAEFDPRYGYPRRFHRLALGASEAASNRDIRWEVRRFEPVPAKEGSDGAAPAKAPPSAGSTSSRQP